MVQAGVWPRQRPLESTLVNSSLFIKKVGRLRVELPICDAGKVFATLSEEWNPYHVLLGGKLPLWNVRNRWCDCWTRCEEQEVHTVGEQDYDGVQRSILGEGPSLRSSVQRECTREQHNRKSPGIHPPQTCPLSGLWAVMQPYKATHESPRLQFTFSSLHVYAKKPYKKRARTLLRKQNDTYKHCNIPLDW